MIYPRPLQRPPEHDFKAHPVMRPLSVPSVRLDDELPLKGHRIVFKIDIQYHELTALQGMKSLLRDNDCFLQVECVEKYARRSCRPSC